MTEEIRSRPYRPTAACERCCFGRGEHEPWCPIKTEATYLISSARMAIDRINIREKGDSSLRIVREA